MFKLRICYIRVTNLLQFTINFQNPTVNFNARCHSRAKIACCSSESIASLYSGNSSIQNASEQFVSCIQLSFLTAFFIQPLKQNCNRVRLKGLKNFISVTISNFLLTITENITYQNIGLSSIITLYIMVDV
jgi:hypothetical protein